MASFYIRTHKDSWYLWEQSYQDQKSIQKKVPREAYPNLGFNPDWDTDKARVRCKDLNKQEKLKRKQAHSIARVTQRVLDIETAKSMYIPQDLVDEFYQKLTQDSFGSESHLKRIHSHFKTVCKILKLLRSQPKDYDLNKERFYRYFIEAKYSLDYTNKLIRIINLFGRYVTSKSQVFYQDLPNPSKHIRNKIEESYQDSGSYIGESDPLTPDMLQIASIKLPEPQYRWMYVSLWYGLRPMEVDALGHPGAFKLEVIGTTKVLSVYQSKLTSLKKDKRWKRIPVLYPEQDKALEFITQGLKRPTRKRLDLVFPDRFITTYAGRKGFLDLMVGGKGQPLEAVSSWMGHQDISITWRKYRDKTSVFLGKKSG